MGRSVSDLDSFLPRGDRDPNTTLAAVGTAIHHWEGVEAALAIIYSIFVGKRKHANVLAEFGHEHKITRDRIRATQDAGERFFAKHPDQTMEGGLRELLDEITQLSNERHRAGHGRLRALPIPVNNVVSFDAPTGLKYLWGAEIYSTKRLKTDWLGVGSDELLASAARFQALERKLLTFAAHLSRFP